MAHPDMPTTERERLAGIHSRKADEIRDGLKQLGLIEEMELPNPKGGWPTIQEPTTHQLRHERG